jgi:hypothetical protein
MKTKEKTLINSKKEIKRIKDIQDLNKAFEKASPDEKRIIIANLKSLLLKQEYILMQYQKVIKIICLIGMINLKKNLSKIL